MKIIAAYHFCSLGLKNCFANHVLQIININQIFSVIIVATDMSSEDATKRLSSKKQTLDDAYAAPANFLEIDVINPITHGVGGKRYVLVEDNTTLG